jgi:hypothetical protein
MKSGIPSGEPSDLALSSGLWLGLQSERARELWVQRWGTLSALRSVMLSALRSALRSARVSWPLKAVQKEIQLAHQWASELAQRLVPYSETSWDWQVQLVGAGAPCECHVAEDTGSGRTEAS